MKISKERENELRDLWIEETNEICTQRWRKALTKAEQSIIEKWDVSDGQQLQKLHYNILKLREEI